MDIRVLQTPMTGEMLQAHKPVKPQKEIHGEGFKDIFNRKMKEVQQWDGTATAKQRPKSM